MTALRYWLQLSLTDGIGPILARRIIEAAGSVAAACEANGTLLKSIERIGPAKGTAIAESLRRAGELVEAELELANRLGARIICPDDVEYPVLLNTIPDPPLVLYVRGMIEPRDLNSIAIVGSRRCSYYGREQAERFAGLLSGAGFTIVSGGARGIDSSAHRGALAHPQGRTIAVLGSGVDVPYPPENAALYDQIASRGVVMSEFAMGTPPSAENFPRRNRIVSGIARGVFVVEADERSGALITARQACDDHSRPVFALPGRVDNALSHGPHHLIQNGAVLVGSLEDILDNLDPPPQGAMEPVAETTLFQSPAELQPIESHALSDRQRLIVGKLSKDAASIDALVDQCNLPAAAILGELTLLTLKGVVKRVDGQGFVRAR